MIDCGTAKSWNCYSNKCILLQKYILFFTAAQVFFKPFWVLLSNQIKKVNRCFVQFWALFVYFWRSFWGLGVSFNKKILDLLMCTINFSFGSTAISFQFQVSPIWGLFLKLFRPFRAIFQNPRGYLSRSLRIFLEFGLDLTLLVMGGVLKTHSLRRSRLRIFLNSNHSANFLDFSYFVITELLKTFESNWCTKHRRAVF